VNIKLVRARVIAVLMGCVAAFLAGESVLRFLPVTSGLSYLPVDETSPVIRFHPNREFVYSKGWNFSMVNRGRINNYGFVNDQYYDERDRSTLMAVIGDSYVEALMVPYRETFHGRLADTVQGCGRVYSFGVSSSSLSQYLVFAEYARTTFQPAAMVIAVVPNDFDESLLKYRRMPGLYGFDQSPPARLSLERVDYRPGRLRDVAMSSALIRYVWIHLHVSGALTRIAERLRRNAAPSWVGNTAATAESERVTDSEKAIDAFLADLPHRSGLPVARVAFVVDGLRPQLYSAETLAAAAGSYAAIMRRYFMAAARQRGYEVIDMEPRFVAHYVRAEQRFEFPRDGHWNAVGHGVVARAVHASSVFERAFGGACPQRALEEKL
jgi:hypothetical protein